MHLLGFQFGVAQWLLAVIGFLASSFPVLAAGMQASHKTLVINQVVVNGRSAIFTKTASSYYGAMGYSLDVSGDSLASASSAGSLHVLNYAGGLEEGTLLAQAKPFIEAQVARLASQIRFYMLANGIGFAWFNYDQKVRVANNPQPMHLVWSVALDQQERAIYGDPRLVPERPSILYATYTPYSVMTGLPQDFAYAGAGYLDWILVDYTFQPLSGWTDINTGGAFDDPQLSSGVSSDPNQGLECLMDESGNTGCSTAYPDIRSLINQNGAAMGLVDVVATLQPVWDEVANKKGGVDQVAELGVSVDTRTWKNAQTLFFIYPAGGATFSETGRIGYALEENVDRYVYRPQTDTYDFINRFTTVALSPTQNFSKSVRFNRTQNAACSSYIEDIIDPFATIRIYSWQNDTVNNLPPDRYTHVATLNCN